MYFIIEDKNQFKSTFRSELENIKNIFKFKQNMRCNNSNANIINNFMIKNVEFIINKFLKFELL